MEPKPWITFQEKLSYIFRFPKNLEEALTHKSFAHEKFIDKQIFAHNERLEFIGDAVLDLAISHLLMQKDFSAAEGELSKRRASLVNEAVLAEMARELGIPEFILLGRGEMNSHGNQKDSILSSAFEAVMGAVFMDGGFYPAYQIIERLFTAKIDAVATAIPFASDFKSRLQEQAQSVHKVAPHYKIISTQGPEHQKVFKVQVILNEKILAEGEGKSRKEAEQAAARKALEGFNES